jgi:NADPH:quinone reductase-like Zn-dependent oxidoreductase
LLFAKHAVGDLAGEVVELGSGVTNFKPGDKVISISFPVRRTYCPMLPFRLYRTVKTSALF